MRLRALLEKRRVAVGLWLVPWAICGWWAMVTSLPHNPQSPGRSAEHRTRALLPEGWGFFTRNPREPDVIVARKHADGTWKIDPPHASASNLFGLDRTSKAVPVESLRLVNNPLKMAADCDAGWATCLERAEPMKIDNTREGPVLCGDVGLLVRAPPPWAWARRVQPDEMPTKTLRLEIDCHDQA